MEEVVITEKDDWAWWRELVTKQEVVMHVQNKVVGRPIRFYLGTDEDHYVSPVNGLPVKVPVLELAGGNALLAKEKDDFMILAPAAARLYVAMAAGVAELTKLSARNAASQGVPLEIGIAVMTSVFRSQVAALEGR